MLSRSLWSLARLFSISIVNGSSCLMMNGEQGGSRGESTGGGAGQGGLLPFYYNLGTLRIA